MVQASDGGVSHDRHALVDGFRRVVEDGVEVGISSETEASGTLLSAVKDHVGTVRESRHAGHDSLGRHAFECPCVIASFRLGGDAIVKSDGSTDGRTATD